MMPSPPVRRPDPDALLAQVKEQESRIGRGQLKIFFGSAPGVGKTFAMLEAARLKKAEGVDVIIGVVETHGRDETARLLDGLEQIPRRAVVHRTATLLEFDLDAALARRPALLLVDELAHTNAPGSRHEKRWQDVEELLAAGLDVYSTLNVQHLESLTDVVAVITGIVVQETVPDVVLERADEVELVDLPPAELVDRLKAGKVYLPEQASRAVDNFFRPGNLSALRELALRRTAERVDAQMRSYMQEHAIRNPWPTAERILVCLPAGPLGTRLVRAGRRAASRLKAELHVVRVERPTNLSLKEQLSLKEPDGTSAAPALRLAEQLGAETAVLNGDNVAEEILNYARRHNVSRIVLGKPRPRRFGRWRGSAADAIIRGSGPLDVWVMSGDRGGDDPPEPLTFRPTSPATAYLGALGVTIVTTLVSWTAYRHLGLPNLAMIYLVGVVISAVRWGRGPSSLCALLSVASLDFCFVPPRFTFSVQDGEYVLTFVIMLAVGLTISALTTRVRNQATLARQRERHTRALYAMSREFAAASSAQSVAEIAVRHIQDVFEVRAVLLLPSPDGPLEPVAGDTSLAADTGSGIGVSRWVFDHGQKAGRGTSTLPGAGGVFLPLMTSHGVLGVLGLALEARAAGSPELMHRVETFTSQTALILERNQLVAESQQVRLNVEAERLRNSLLSSVSHDLRTPLASITGAASSLLQGEPELPAPIRVELARSIYEEASRLNRLVANLLDMTRLDSGALELKQEWYSLEEIVGSALSRLDEALRRRSVQIRLAEDLPLLFIDGVLIEQVLVNLIENAAKYTPPGAPLTLSAEVDGDLMRVTLVDSGPGLPSGDEERVFDRFYRGAGTGTVGIGLGLSICRGFVEAHGGRISARNRPEGGAAFTFELPLSPPPPEPATERPGVMEGV